MVSTKNWVTQAAEISIKSAAKRQISVQHRKSVTGSVSVTYISPDFRTYNPKCHTSLVFLSNFSTSWEGFPPWRFNFGDQSLTYGDTEVYFFNIVPWLNGICERYYLNHILDVYGALIRAENWKISLWWHERKRAKKVNFKVRLLLAQLSIRLQDWRSCAKNANRLVMALECSFVYFFHYTG